MKLFHMVDGLVLNAKAKLHNFMYEENGDVNIVSMVVLIGIAVTLAIVFKEGIGELLNTLIGTIKGKATEAVGGGSTTPPTK